MKVYISVDMEGITGVTGRPHVDPSHAEYTRFRKLMTEDVNAAVEGALEAGATEIVVNDSHSWMYNVLIEELHPAAQLLSGSNKAYLQMHDIDESFAAAFFIGYHAMEGAADAMLDHTLIGRTVTRIKCNGKEVGESALNAAMAGYYGVPVALVTGDDKVAQEVEETIDPRVNTVVVKQSVNRFAARCLPPRESHRLIREGAAKALRELDKLQPYRVEGPVTFEITFKTTAEAAITTLLPTVTSVDSKTVAVTANNYKDAYRLMLVCLLLGRTADGGVLS